MRRALCIVMALLVAAAAAQAQDAQKILDTYRRNFAIASLDVKIQILQDAAGGKTAPDMGPLYQQAIDFVVENAGLISTDARFNQLAEIGAEQIGIIGFTAGRSSVWRLFRATADSQTLAKAAGALGAVGAGDAETIDNLNRYVESQNTRFSSGKAPDAAVFSASLQALGKLGDPSSFPVLFSAVNLGAGDQITAIARNALFAIRGDFSAMLFGVIKDRALPEKRLALQMAIDSDKLTDDKKAQIAELALDIGMHSNAPDAAGKAALRDMRFVAAAALGARKWSHATPYIIEHFDMTIGEFDKGLVDRNHLLDTMNILGAMSTHEAAVRLTQFLVLINSYMEKGKAYEDQIVLTVIANLGALGDKVAFDDLMYTGFLNYPANVKKAARAALDKLKW